MSKLTREDKIEIYERRKKEGNPNLWLNLRKMTKNYLKKKKLEEENLYLKAENEYLKKLRALVQERELKEKKK